MGGGHSKDSPWQNGSSETDSVKNFTNWSPPEPECNHRHKCRSFRGAHIDEDWPTFADADRVNREGYSFALSNCLYYNDKKNRFKDIFNQPYLKELGWELSDTKGGWGIIGKGLGCNGDTERIIYSKQQHASTLKDCCNSYTGNSADQKKYCDICTCVEYKDDTPKCTSGAKLESCIYYFNTENIDTTKEIILSTFDETNQNDPKYIKYSEFISKSLLILNSTDCDYDLIKQNIALVMSSKLINFIDLFLELLNNSDIQKSEMKQNDLVSLLSSDIIKNIMKNQDSSIVNFNNKFNTFCNNDTIFDGNDWDKKIKLYGKICSCFWDTNKNNGNPSNLQKNKIELLKSKSNIPDELKEYAQFASDIEPNGPIYCWDSQCINNDNNLIPNRDDCPSTNIASCLAYINFDNKGLIKGNITNLAACAATIDNEKQKETLEKLIEKYREEFDNGGSSGPSNNSGSKPKNKKKKTTTRIIVGIVIFIVFVIIIGIIAIFS